MATTLTKSSTAGGTPIDESRGGFGVRCRGRWVGGAETLAIGHLEHRVLGGAIYSPGEGVLQAAV